jgi:hypothetical protein
MKKIAYLLLVAGFLHGTYVAALDEKVVDWTLFAFAAAAAIAGVLLAKRASSAEARSGSVLEMNRNELNESLANIVRDLDELAGGTVPTDEALRHWIDNTLRNDLASSNRDADIVGPVLAFEAVRKFAAGERYINRVWSSAADGYNEEAHRYLDRAVEQFRLAKSQLAAASE